MTKLSRRYFILSIIILISVVGGLITIYTTGNGPWGYSDPVIYISTARNIDRGLGLVYYEADAALRYITIEPPIYPIFLSAIGLFNVNLVAAARWLNIFAFVASIFIAGWIFFRYSRAPALGIFASALMCVFPYMVWMFSSAYSEPLFILTFLTGGLALLAYLHNSKASLFLTSAVLIGLIPVTRYAGIAMVPAGAAGVLLFASGRLWSRIKKAALFSAIASLPIVVWLCWIYSETAHSVGGRSLAISLEGLSAQFQDFRGVFMDTVWKWVPFQSHNLLLRYRLRFILMGIGLAVMLALILMAYRQMKKKLENPGDSGLQIFTFFGLSAVFFVAVLIGTYLFTHPTIDVDNRMLLPLFVGSVMAFYAAFSVWQTAWFQGKLSWLQLMPWAIAIVCIVWYYPQTHQEVNFYRAGDGLTAYRWSNSAIIQAVQSLPADQPVISNDWELLQLWTGRPVYGFWNTFPIKPAIQESAYGTVQADPVQSVFCNKAAALVIFNDFMSEFQSLDKTVSNTQVQGLFAGLSLYQTYPDGIIYLCP